MEPQFATRTMWLCVIQRCAYLERYGGPRRRLMDWRGNERIQKRICDTNFVMPSCKLFRAWKEHIHYCRTNQMVTRGSANVTSSDIGKQSGSR